MEQQQANDSSSAPFNKLEIIDAVPLAVALPTVKPRRRRISNENLMDGTSIGLPDGWTFEQRPRANISYIGKIDQFFYEPGTNKQFRSMKSVERYLASKGQKRNPITPKGLQENAQQMTVAPAPLPFDLSTADRERSNQESSNNRSKMKKKKKKKATPKLFFNFKDTPEQVTWVLSDAKNDKWAAYMGDIKVDEKIQHFWSDTFRIINGVKFAHRSYDERAKTMKTRLEELNEDLL